jgi:beta-lactamase regulating signal transducer with metallopeptidase domain
MLDWLRIDGTFCLRVTLTLLHFLWQGTVLALAAEGAAAALRKRGAAARALVYLAALVGMAACLPLTYSLIDPARGAEAWGGVVEDIVAADAGTAARRPAAPAFGAGEFQNGITKAAADARANAEANRAEATALDAAGVAFVPVAWTSLARRAAPAVAAVYFAGVSLMLARLLLGLRGGRNLRRQAWPVEDGALLQVVARAARRLRMTATPAVAWCGSVAVPTVVGIARPVILLPVSLASGLTPQQIEMLLLHELAHLRRHDPWLNLLQWTIESVFFFHPAVWWISGRVRAERELACDDCVLAAGVGRRPYAESLLRMAEISRAARAESPAFALGLKGPRRSAFSTRVRRLIEGREPNEQLRLARVWPLAVMFVALMFVGMVGGLNTNTAAQINLSGRGDAAAVEAVFSAPADLAPSGEAMPGVVREQARVIGTVQQQGTLKGYRLDRQPEQKGDAAEQRWILETDQRLIMRTMLVTYGPEGEVQEHVGGGGSRILEQGPFELTFTPTRMGNRLRGEVQQRVQGAGKATSVGTAFDVPAGAVLEARVGAEQVWLDSGHFRALWEGRVTSGSQLIKTLVYAASISTQDGDPAPAREQLAMVVRLNEQARDAQPPQLRQMGWPLPQTVNDWAARLTADLQQSSLSQQASAPGMGAGINLDAAAQAVQRTQPEMITLRFPAERSMGRLIDLGATEATPGRGSWPRGVDAAHTRDARGDVSVPGGSRVGLELSFSGLDHLSDLERIGAPLQGILIERDPLSEARLEPLRRVKGLTWVGVELPRMEAERFAGVMRSIAAVPGLKRLQLITNGNFSVDDLQAISVLPGLHEIAVDLRRAPAAGTWQALLALPRLDSLTLHGVTGDELLELPPLPRLRELQLAQASFEPGELAALERLPELEALQLATPADDETLADLRRLPRLRRLSLTQAGPTAREATGDYGLELLAAMPQIESLSFSSCSFSPAGLRLLGQLPKLKRLNLAQAHFMTQPEFAALAQLPALQELSLNGRDATREAIATLSAMPGLRALRLRDLPQESSALDLLPGVRPEARVQRGFDTTVRFVTQAASATRDTLRD